MLNYLTAGESHGPQLTAILDGLPAGLKIDLDRLNFQLARRQKGYGRGGRMKIEQDRAQIVSGVRNGVTLGSPISIVIQNKDWENWTRIMDPIAPIADDLNLKEQRLAHETTFPRPGHADFPGAVKYNQTDMRNVLERASARETAARTAIGALARQLLERFDIQIASHVVRIGEVELPDGYDISDLTTLMNITEESEVRCLDRETEEQMIEAIRAAKKNRDSLGGVVELIVRRLPVGLGGYSQWSRRLDGRLASVLMSVHSVKGVEVGLGFRSSALRGSEVHDEIFYKKGSSASKKDLYRKTNRAGGLEGGMTNGEDLILRVGAKPISTLNKPLKTVDMVTKKSAEAMVERTDNCVVPALGVVCEAVVSLVLADSFLEKFGADNMMEIERAYQAYLNTEI
ncbi:MAG TPA: chorismate synthase [candidate division Zixibacteria bacterium]|nr:chorismate synthase [candidate division Zixibacteria bacterium]